jgi:hypothetical protein
MQQYDTGNQLRIFLYIYMKEEMKQVDTFFQGTLLCNLMQR